MERGSAEAAQLEAQLLPRLELLWRARAQGRLRDACVPELDALFMYPCALGHAKNFYGRAGLPRTHNAWEMQLLVDDGLLFFIYVSCVRALLEAEDVAQLGARVDSLCADLELDAPERTRARTRAFYAAHIEAFVGQQRARLGLGAQGLFALEGSIIGAYLRVAVAAPEASLCFDSFPANTGPNNVSEGLKGLVSIKGRGDGAAGARRFWSIRAESYTRFYGINLVKQLGLEGLRFGLVVPYANGVRHIAITRCWPIDGAENIARYVETAQAARRELERAWARRELEGAAAGGRAATILVSGYSQGGAAVRLFSDALAGIDPRAREYFSESIPRGYRRRCRALALASAGPERWPLVVHTVSVATMGGIDGVAFAERYPQLPDLAQDQRGAAGVVARANAYGGLHLAICHDFDPARWIVPGPLLRRRRSAAARRRHKHTLVRILLRFGGPAKALHGGVWTAGTERAFAQNEDARALLDEVCARVMSPRFVDEAEYYDERCTRASFPHLVMGALGYPGWAIVAKFAEARAELERRRGGEETWGGEEAWVGELLREPSWRCDILPRELGYEEVVGRAQALDLRLRARAQAIMAQARGAESEELFVALRARFGDSGARRHLLDG